MGWLATVWTRIRGWLLAALGVVGVVATLGALWYRRRALDAEGRAECALKTAHISAARARVAETSAAETARLLDERDAAIERLREQRRAERERYTALRARLETAGVDVVWDAAFGREPDP